MYLLLIFSRGQFFSTAAEYFLSLWSTNSMLAGKEKNVEPTTLRHLLSVRDQQRWNIGSRWEIKKPFSVSISFGFSLPFSQTNTKTSSSASSRNWRNEKTGQFFGTSTRWSASIGSRGREVVKCLGVYSHLDDRTRLKYRKYDMRSKNRIKGWRIQLPDPLLAS